MSYCRWSSDDFQCDVYVYESVSGGYATHVAGARYVFDRPLPKPVAWVIGGGVDENMAFFDRDRLISEMIEAATLVPIGLPCDGDSFDDDDANECANRLERLRGMGYVVPQYAIDALREEYEANPKTTEPQPKPGSEGQWET